MANCTDEQRFILMKKFDDMDTNGNNYLSKEEIAECVKSSNLPSDKVDEFLSLFDNNGDDKVTRHEYEMALGLKDVPPTTVEHWEEAFKEMDKDGSGKLTPEEMYEGLSKAGCELSKDKIMSIISSVDSDNDKVLTFKEFQTLMRL